MAADRIPVAAGTLYVVATPIGNLDDMTLRALKILAQVELVVAEDTRHSGRLLAHHGLTCRLLSCHEHNQAQRIPGLLNKLRHGATIALLTDAGTPAISDPGYLLVHAARQAGLPVIPVPGPSAALAALSVAGLPSNQFVFIGFMPEKKGRRQRLLASQADQRGTHIFYESPRRIVRLMAELLSVWGDRPAFLGREMTKRHEEYLSGSLSDLYHQLEKRAIVKGECTLLVGGREQGAGGRWQGAGDRWQGADDEGEQGAEGRELGMNSGVVEEAAALEGALDELARASERSERLGNRCAQIAARWGLSRRTLYQAALGLPKQTREGDEP